MASESSGPAEPRRCPRTAAIRSHRPGPSLRFYPRQPRMFEATATPPPPGCSAGTPRRPRRCCPQTSETALEALGISWISAARKRPAPAESPAHAPKRHGDADTQPPSPTPPLTGACAFRPGTRSTDFAWTHGWAGNELPAGPGACRRNASKPWRSSGSKGDLVPRGRRQGHRTPPTRPRENTRRWATIDQRTAVGWSPLPPPHRLAPDRVSIMQRPLAGGPAEGPRRQLLCAIRGVDQTGRNHLSLLSGQPSDTRRLQPEPRTEGEERAWGVRRRRIVKGLRSHHKHRRAAAISPPAQHVH